MRVLGGLAAFCRRLWPEATAGAASGLPRLQNAVAAPVPDTVGDGLGIT
jgi:hypothetical protein